MPLTTLQFRRILFLSTALGLFSSAHFSRVFGFICGFGTRIVKDKTRYEELSESVAYKPVVSKERWFTLSLAEQLGHIGSEVGKAAKWQSKDEKSFWGAVTRSLGDMNIRAPSLTSSATSCNLLCSARRVGYNRLVNDLLRQSDEAVRWEWRGARGRHALYRPQGVRLYCRPLGRGQDHTSEASPRRGAPERRLGLF